MYFSKHNLLLATSASDSGPDVLPYWLPATDPGRQQLRAGWANSAGATPNATSFLGGRRWEPPPSEIPATSAWQGGLQGWAADPTDGGHFLRYRGSKEILSGSLKSLDACTLQNRSLPGGDAVVFSLIISRLSVDQRRACQANHTALIASYLTRMLSVLRCA